jgi:hypothetical protein
MVYYWWVPLRLWRFGILEEPFFLHDFFRHSDLHHDRWDIGLRVPARVRHDVVRLHQQGINRQDKFGSDFALTIDVRGAFELRKTVLFQTKLADNYSANITRAQLEEALAIPEFRGRAFAMSLDRQRAVIRIQSMDLLLKAFSKPKQVTKTFDTTEWVPSTDWIVRWFECDFGRPSPDGDDSPIERILASRIIEPTETFPRYETLHGQIADNVFIPEVWHHATIKIGETGNA